MRWHGTVMGGLRESLDSRLKTTMEMLEDPACTDEKRKGLEMRYFQTLNQLGRYVEEDKFAKRLFNVHLEKYVYYKSERLLR